MTAGEGRGRREQAPSPQARSGLRRNMDVSREQESQNDFWRPPAPPTWQRGPQFPASDREAFLAV